MGRPMKQVSYNPCSFRPVIKVSEDFVCLMIDLFIDLEEEGGKSVNRTEFLSWYRDQIKMSGTCEESQNLQSDTPTQRAKELFEKWFRGMVVASHWKEARRRKLEGK